MQLILAGLVCDIESIDKVVHVLYSVYGRRQRPTVLYSLLGHAKSSLLDHDI